MFFCKSNSCVLHVLLLSFRDFRRKRSSQLFNRLIHFLVILGFLVLRILLPFFGFMSFLLFPSVSCKLCPLSRHLCALHMASTWQFRDPLNTDRTRTWSMESWSMRDETELFAHYAHFAPPKFHPDRFRRWK